MIKLIHHEKPELTKTEFNCDKPLCKWLEDDPLLKHLNKTHFSIFLGSKGSGKTSLMTSFLRTKKKWKYLYHYIYVFMPDTSMKSMKNNLFENHDPSRLFEVVNFDNLNKVYKELLNHKTNNHLSLVIFDDVQSQLKTTENEQAILQFISNARHLYCSIVFCCQNYKSIPLSIRIKADAYFLFNLSKQEYQSLYEDWIQVDKDFYKSVIRTYKKVDKKEPHSFIFLKANGNVIFINWDEVINPDYDDDNLIDF